MSEMRAGSGLRLLAVVVVLGVAPALAQTPTCPSGPPCQGGLLPGPLPLFPASNWWNLDISAAPVDPNSANFINFIGVSKATRPDFGGEVSPGSADVYGFPYVNVNGTQPKKIVTFLYAGESDGVGVPFYPIPDEAITLPHWIEEGYPGNVDRRTFSDRHLLIVDGANQLLYELYNVFYDGSSWQAGSGAFFDMKTNNRRPEGFTSADAAGLAILPGLVRYDEAYLNPDPIRHAIRVTVRASNNYVFPASHLTCDPATNSCPTNALPMGARLRLKPGVSVASADLGVQRIVQAMKTYGLIVADNGSDLFFSGTFDTRWDNGILNPAFGSLHASDFEVIQRGYGIATCTPGGAFDTDGDSIPDTVESAEGTNPCVKDNDVFTSARRFAMQQYRDFLRREGDVAGIAYWTATINGGTSRAVVTKSFFDSPEFQGAIAPVTRLYFAYFNRIPDKPGLDYWIGQYRAGLPLASISQAFAASPEFIATYGSLSDSAFVTLVYNNVLGRAPDAVGFAYWTVQLTGGFMTRGQIMVGFSESPEYQQRSYNRVFVTMTYYGMLRRVPEQLGFDYWLANLNAGVSTLTLINGFLAAPEYRGRFLP